MSKQDLESQSTVRSRVDDFLRTVTEWARRRSDVECVLLVGSYARGTASLSSDVDLMLLVNEPEKFEKDNHWIAEFGKPITIIGEQWGVVRSLRVEYDWGAEVEFCLATVSWVSLPLDRGTLDVIKAGARVLLDTDSGILAQAITSSSS